ncbi:MAG: hypothetical protein AAB214_00770, partial [Fibrobacterota bacterium]
MFASPRILIATFGAALFVSGCQSGAVDSTETPTPLDLKLAFVLPIADSATYPDSIRWKAGDGIWKQKAYTTPTVVVDPFTDTVAVHLDAGVRTIVVEWYTGGVPMRTANYQVASATSATKTFSVDSASLQAYLLERHSSYDPSLVPLARWHYGEFMTSFLDTVAAPSAEASVWWGTDSVNMRKLSGPIWIDRTVELYVQARKPGAFGPKLVYSYVLRPKIVFNTPDWRSQYNENNAIGNALKSAGIYGFGWNSIGSLLNSVNTGTRVGAAIPDKYLSIDYSLGGANPNLGIGLQIGGSVDSLTEKGQWGIDLRPMERLRAVFNFTPALNDSMELVVQIASMDPVYQTACNNGGCLRYALTKSEIANGVLDIPVTSLVYPDWYQWGAAVQPKTADVMRRAAGIVFLVGGKGKTYSAPVSGKLEIQ